MESNRIYHYLFKYAFLIFGLLIMIVPIISFVFPNSVEINGEKGSTDLTITIIIGLIGLLSMLLFIVVKDKFAIVELKNQTIIIKQNGDERTVNWSDVTSISQIQSIRPPLYRLKTTDSDKTIWFNTEPRYISVNGFTSDLSEMGEFITKKKSEFGL